MDTLIELDHAANYTFDGIRFTGTTANLITRDGLASQLGCSLYGADALAKQGYSYKEILEYFYTEITNENTDKWNAIKFLTNELGISKDEVMAIGDNVNDKMMIENAGCGVAMGNSAPYIKESADIVVSNNNEDGVAEAIEQNF